MLSTTSNERDGIGTIYSITSYNDKIITAGHDTIIRIWNAVDGILLNKIKSEHTHLIKCLSIYKSSDENNSNDVDNVDNNNNIDYLISGSWDTTCNVFTIGNTSKGIDIGYLHTLKGHKNRVKSLCTCKTTYQDNEVKGRKLVAFSGSDDNTIIAWDIISSELLYSLEGHTRMVTGLDYSSSILGSCSADKTIRIWSTLDRSCNKIISDQSADITCILFVKSTNNDDNDDLKLLCSGNTHGTISIYNALSGDRLYKFEEYNSSLSSLALYYHKMTTYLLATTRDGCLMSYDIKSAIKGPFFGKLNIKEEINENEDTFFWDKRPNSNELFDSPTYVLHSICSSSGAVVVAGADGLLLFFRSQSFEKEYIPPPPKVSRKMYRNLSDSNIDDNDDDKSISSKSRGYDRNNPHIYKSMKSNKSMSRKTSNTGGLSSSKSYTKEDMFQLGLGKPNPLSNSRMQQLISSNNDDNNNTIDETSSSQLLPQLSPIRLRDNKSNNPTNETLLRSENQKDNANQSNEVYSRRASFQNNSNVDDNLGRYPPRSSSSNDTKKVMFIKKDNGEMIPIPVQTQLSDIKKASRLGRRVIQPISSLSTPSSIYFSDNNNNTNNLNDNKTQQMNTIKVSTTTVNLFENFCEEGDKKTLGKLKSHNSNRIATRRIVKCYINKY